MEARTQVLDLPEENAAIFHFLIAYLYEGKYNPIKPASSVLGMLPCCEPPPPRVKYTDGSHSRRLG